MKGRFKTRPLFVLPLVNSRYKKQFAQGAKPTEELQMIQNSMPVASPKLLWLHCFYSSQAIKV